MNTLFGVNAPKVPWWFVVSIGSAALTGCAASQTGDGLDPQILQIHRTMDSWTGEYRGRVDHGRWFLRTGSTIDQRLPLNPTSTNDSWQREQDLRVDLTIRFVPDEMGGQLHLSLSLVDTFQVQPWNLSYGRVIDDLERRDVDRGALEFDFMVPRDIPLSNEHQLGGTWSEKNESGVSAVTTWRAERYAEFSFERVSGEISGVLKYSSRVQQVGDYRSEEKHEMKLMHLWEKDAGLISSPVVLPAKP